MKRNQLRRRATDMATSAREQIISALAGVDDPNQKLLLLLMLTVVDEIGGKLEAILTDEESLRQAVLNGHTADHHAHHEWISAQIQAESDTKSSRSRIRDGLLEKLLWSALSGAAVYLATRL